MTAALYGHYDCVKELLDSGAQINQVKKDKGNTYEVFCNDFSLYSGAVLRYHCIEMYCLQVLLKLQVSARIFFQSKLGYQNNLNEPLSVKHITRKPRN
jgi:ankyrin repeat protein